MDRDQLNTILADMTDDTLSVKPNGNLCTSDGDEYGADDVRAIAEQVREEVARLQKVLAWAVLAPEYEPSAE
jgi:hypothetical protein